MVLIWHGETCSGKRIKENVFVRDIHLYNLYSRHTEIMSYLQIKCTHRNRVTIKYVAVFVTIRASVEGQDFFEESESTKPIIYQSSIQDYTRFYLELSTEGMSQARLLLSTTNIVPNNYPNFRTTPNQNLTLDKRYYTVSISWGRTKTLFSAIYTKTMFSAFIKKICSKLDEYVTKTTFQLSNFRDEYLLHLIGWTRCI